MRTRYSLCVFVDAGCAALSTQHELGSIVGGACYSFVDTALPKRAVTVYEMVFLLLLPRLFIGIAADKEACWGLSAVIGLKEIELY